MISQVLLNKYKTLKFSECDGGQGQRDVATNWVRISGLASILGARDRESR
jgi:hypothetical protein